MLNPIYSPASDRYENGMLFNLFLFLVIRINVIAPCFFINLTSNSVYVYGNLVFRYFFYHTC